MKTTLAWRNVVDNRGRAVVTVGSVCFAILLIYMQLGFYETTRRSSTLVYDQLEFDVVLVSPHYVHLRFAGSFPKQRLAQAEAVDGVSRAVPLYVGNGDYRSRADGSPQEAMVLGVDPVTQPFRLPDVRTMLPKLARTGTAIMDRTTTSRTFGPIEPDTKIEFNGRQLDLIGVFSHGTGFIVDGSLVVGQQTMPSIFPGYSLQRVSIGLVQLDSDADHDRVVRGLQDTLPPDVLVWTRQHVEESERTFFMSVKPSGIFFEAGVVLGFTVGIVVLYQILASEVTRQMKEYATLKAMGYHSAALHSIILQQACIYALLGFIPATGLAFLLYAEMRRQTRLPMVMTGGRVVVVLAVSLLICLSAGWLASRKAHQKDPADLF